MRTITKEVYTFAELSESAKETARDKYREHNLEGYDWWDSVYEDAKTIGNLFGLRIDRIYFSGFWSQGDGAYFEGDYQYRKGALKAVIDYMPLDNDLHDIVKRLQDVQRKAFYGLYASTKSGHGSNFYSHSGVMQVSVDCDKRDITESEEDDITQCLREYADWIYSRLEAEYEYLQSDEVIDEYLNDCEFDEEGELI